MEESEIDGLPDQSENPSPTVLLDSPMFEPDKANAVETSPDLCFVKDTEHIPLFDDAGLNGVSGYSEEGTVLERNGNIDEQGISSENTSTSVYPEGSSQNSLSSEQELFVSESMSELLELEAEINEFETERLDDTITEKENQATVDIDSNIRNRISMLHCYICGNLYSVPKLLNCLHTFCLKCLKDLIFYKEHKKIECVVCGQKTHIPDVGMTALPDNVVVKNVLAFKAAESEAVYCDICALHHLQVKVSGKCLDCGDKLCAECCEKHTFSRQTVNHTVTSLQDQQGNEIKGTKSRENLILNCQEHQDEKLKFYCVACQVIVCRDCILVAHNLHQVLTSEQVMLDIRDGVAKKVDQLNESQSSFYEELAKYEHDLLEAENQQVKTLESAYHEVKASIEEKFQTCLNDITAQYSELREKCQKKKEKMGKRKETVEEVKANVEFMMEQGLDSEIAALQQIIKRQLDNLQNDYQAIGPAVNTNGPLPSVDIFGDNCMTVKKMMLFRASRPRNKSGGKRNANENVKSETNHSEHSLSSRLGSLGLEKKPKVSMRPAGMRHDGPSSFPEHTPIRQAGPSFPGHSQSLRPRSPNQTNLPSLLGPYIPPPKTSPNRFSSIGHSSTLLPGQFSNAQNMSQNLSDNLANTENPFPQSVTNNRGGRSGGRRGGMPDNLPADRGANFDYNGDMDQDSSSQCSDTVPVKMKWKRRTPRAVGEQGESLVLKETLSVFVLQDQQEPRIVGMTFIGVSDFAVCDANNRKIKIFSICGKFLYVILEKEPMTVTFCNGCLVWNAMTDKVLTKHTDKTDHRIRKKRFQPDMAHPVTTFQDKYLVANVQGKIAFFQTDGKSCENLLVWINLCNTP